MLETKFSDFARTGLALGGSLLDTLTHEAQAGIETALHAGAKLCLELDGMPLFNAAHLVLVEREGRRHVLTSVQLKQGPMQ